MTRFQQTQTRLATATRVRRTLAGLSTAEAASRARVPEDEILEIERGEGNPHLDTLGRLAGAYGCAVHLLLADWRHGVWPEALGT